MSTPVDRVRQALAAQGLQAQVTEFDRSTATSQQAADTLRVPVATIVKSLVFLVDERPVLALASGANRVDLDKLGRAAGVLVTSAAWAAGGCCSKATART